MVYSYYDYLEKYYEDYYDSYYENYYWPYYYGVITFENQTYICNNTAYTLPNTTTINTNQTSVNGTIINGTLCHSFNKEYPPSPYEYKHPWNLNYITPPLFGLSATCAVLSIIIAAIFFRKVREGIKSHTDRSKKIVTWITSFAIICHLGYGIVDPIMYYFWWMGFNLKSAIRTEIAWEIWWLSTKLSLYVVYTYRYYMIYTGAKFVSYAQKCLIFGGFAVVMIIQAVLFAFYVVSYVQWLREWEEEDLEARRMYLNLAWAFLAIDFLFIFAICFLLNRAILQIVIGTEKSTENKLAEYVSDNPSMVVSTPSIQSIPSLQISANASHSNCKAVVKQARQKRDIHLRKNDLMHATTKIALICTISMVSSIFVQGLWLIQEELEHGILQWVSYIWCLDNIINMLCIHLLLAVAKTHYKFCCKKICKFHQCCLFFMIKIVDIQTEHAHKELLLSYQNSLFSSSDRRSTVDKSKTNEDTIDTKMSQQVSNDGMQCTMHIQITELEIQKSNEDTIDGKITKMDMQKLNESVINSDIEKQISLSNEVAEMEKQNTNEIQMSVTENIDKRGEININV